MLEVLQGLYPSLTYLASTISNKSKTFLYFTTVYKIKYVKFFLVSTSRHMRLLYAIFSLSTHPLNLVNLEYLTAFRILGMEMCSSFKPFFTIKQHICAQHRIWIYYPFKSKHFLAFIHFFINLILTLLDDSTPKHLNMSQLS